MSKAEKQPQQLEEPSKSTKPDVVCSQASEVADELSSSLWKPLTLTCAYVLFLRTFYYECKGTGDGGSLVFHEVWFAPPLVATVSYIALIFGLKRWMANRKPMALKDYMFTYNLYQTILNLWCVCAFIKELYVQNMTIWGNKVDTSPSGFRLGFLIWVHYNNKYIELLDTVFMALRKKNNQISFLHMYHHVLLIWAWFAVCKLACGGDAYFGALANSFVHVLMYGYYLLALLKINTPWKKWLTNIQMAQFVVCFAHSIYCFVYDIYPKSLCMLETWVMLNMLVLFGNFYRQTYLKAKKNKMSKDKAQ